MPRRKHIAAIIAAFAVLLFVGSGALWWVTRPVVTAVVTEVHLFADGATKVMTEPVTPRRLWFLTRDALPDRAPVYTILPSGDKRPGVVFHNATDHGLMTIDMPLPQRVVLQRDGSYSVAAKRIACIIDDGTFSPGYTQEYPNARSVPIVYGPWIPHAGIPAH